MNLLQFLQGAPITLPQSDPTQRNDSSSGLLSPLPSVPAPVPGVSVGGMITPANNTQLIQNANMGKTNLLSPAAAPLNITQGQVLGDSTFKNPLEGFNQQVPQQYRDLVIQSANQSGVDPRVLAAILQQESGFKADITGAMDSNDRGIAQINRQAFPNITDQQAYDPNFAIKFAAQLLSNNLKATGGDVNRGLAAYNVGLGGVKQGVGTRGQQYVDAVVKNLDPELRKQLGFKASYDQGR